MRLNGRAVSAVLALLFVGAMAAVWLGLHTGYGGTASNPRPPRGLRRVGSGAEQPDIPRAGADHRDRSERLLGHRAVEAHL